MAKQILDQEYSTARQRARQLGISIRDLESTTMVGAYISRPLNLIEFCLHEAAHLVTMGHHPKEFPALRRWYGRPLTEVVTDRFELISADAADRLEIDAARVTFVAGQRLELWDDPDAIITSTRRNLSVLSRWSDKQTLMVQQAFGCLERAEWSGWGKCNQQTSLVVTWFQGSSR